MIVRPARVRRDRPEEGLVQVRPEADRVDRDSERGGLQRLAEGHRIPGRYTGATLPTVREQDHHPFLLAVAVCPEFIVRDPNRIAEVRGPTLVDRVKVALRLRVVRESVVAYLVQVVDGPAHVGADEACDVVEVNDCDAVGMTEAPEVFLRAGDAESPGVVPHHGTGAVHQKDDVLVQRHDLRLLGTREVTVCDRHVRGIRIVEPELAYRCGGERRHGRGPQRDRDGERRARARISRGERAEGREGLEGVLGRDELRVVPLRGNHGDKRDLEEQEHDEEGEEHRHRGRGSAGIVT